jgi:hypothetical protein
MCPLVYNIVHVYIGSLRIKYYLRPRIDVILVFKYYLQINVRASLKRLFIFFLKVRNRDFYEKLPSNGFSKWLNKYSHLLFRIFR